MDKLGFCLVVLAAVLMLTGVVPAIDASKTPALELWFYSFLAGSAISAWVAFAILTRDQWCRFFWRQ